MPRTRLTATRKYTAPKHRPPAVAGASIQPKRASQLRRAERRAVAAEAARLDLEAEQAQPVAQAPVADELAGARQEQARSAPVPGRRRMRPQALAQPPQAGRVEADDRRPGLPAPARARPRAARGAGRAPARAHAAARRGRGCGCRTAARRSRNAGRRPAAAAACDAVLGAASAGAASAAAPSLATQRCGMRFARSASSSGRPSCRAWNPNRSATARSRCACSQCSR